MIYRILLVGFLTIASTQTLCDEAAEHSADSMALQKILQRIRSFEANIEQSVTNQYGEEVDKVSGYFVARKPQQFRWQTETQTILADGKVLYSIDHDLEQVEVRWQKEALQNSPVLILTKNAAELAEAFEVKHAGEHEGTHLYQLTPKNPGAAFEKIHLLVRGEKIIELLFSDALGQKTVVHFSKIRINQPVSDEVFKADIPTHYDRIDNRNLEAVE